MGKTKNWKKKGDMLWSFEKTLPGEDHVNGKGFTLQVEILPTSGEGIDYEVVMRLRQIYHNGVTSTYETKTLGYSNNKSEARQIAVGYMKDYPTVSKALRNLHNQSGWISASNAVPSPKDVGGT